MKMKVLLCGEHPYCRTGNGNMMRAILAQIDYEKYEVVCYVAGQADPRCFDPFKKLPYSIITSNAENDPLGINLLPSLLETSDFDLLFMIGVDIWNYIPILKYIIQLKKVKKFKWGALFPYEFLTPREEILKVIKQIDYPFVYSRYGRDILKSKDPRVKYFRPPLLDSDKYYQKSKKEIKYFKNRKFANLPNDAFIFGFIGPNQYRKEPHKVLKAFSKAIKRIKRPVYLYMHTQLTGIYDLNQLVLDFNIDPERLLAKHPNNYYDSDWMCDIYNVLDSYICTSMQEGLSWTVVESMLCGTPIIASDSSAHKELINNSIGTLVPCHETGMLPIVTERGGCLVEAPSCNVDMIMEAMIKTVNESEVMKEDDSRYCVQRGKEWLNGVNNINFVFDEMIQEKEKQISIKKKDRLLFAQHSSAGDVLMTTRCFKGLKERYNIPIDYMTSKPYMNIIENNPYIENVIEWNEELYEQYKFVLNPHADKILPGHWGRNCNSILSDFYWKILDVVPDDFFIYQKNPKIQALDIMKNLSIVILHTTGGDAHFRTYKYMVDVAQWLKRNRNCITIQLGGKDDFLAGADIDLRGKLTFQESAWVMKKAELAITVDSFISHLAGIFGISQVCLFGSGNANVVRPNQIKGTLICLSPDYVKNCPALGPCSQSKKDCFLPCTGSHKPEKIIQAILEIEKIAQGEVK